jgi:hypothetical protein
MEKEEREGKRERWREKGMEMGERELSVCVFVCGFDRACVRERGDKDRDKTGRNGERAGDKRDGRRWEWK